MTKVLTTPIELEIGIKDPPSDFISCASKLVPIPFPFVLGALEDLALLHDLVLQREDGESELVGL